MTSVTLSNLETLVVGLCAFMLGRLLTRSVPALGRLNLPVAVVGGLLIATITAIVRAAAQVEITFAQELTDTLLLVFFTTIGLTAKLSTLKAGGKPLLWLCLVTVLMIVCQNLIGIGIAMSRGAHPYYGLLVGSVSFVGGPGTAAAWAKEAEAYGIPSAAEVAIGAATLAIVAGALVSGPLAGWLVERKRLQAAAQEKGAKAAPTKPKAPRAATIDETMSTILWIMLAVLIGAQLNEWARGAGMVLPGFLTAMIAGVLITNLSDVFGLEIDFAPIERGGEVALQTFLSIFLMSLKIWTLGVVIGPLLVNVGVQVLVTVLIAVFVLFRALGRDYDAAVTVAGFLGFGLSSMPVAMASMDKVTKRYGPSPRAFLLITLAGSFFVDLANATIVKAFLALPMF